MAFALASLLATLSVRVRAKEPESELATARHLFAEATVLESHSDFELAAAKLKSAIAIKETPGLRYHLAHCEERLGQLIAASEDYARAAELVRDGFRAPDVELLLPTAEQRVNSRIARLDFVLPAGTRAAAELDGRALPGLESLRLDPGVHRVVVRAPGHSAYQTELLFADGQRRTLKILFDEPEEASPASVAASRGARSAGVTPPATRKPASVRLRRALLIGEAAVAVAGLGVGIGAAVVRHRSEQEIEAYHADIRDYQEEPAQHSTPPDQDSASSTGLCPGDPYIQEDCSGLEAATHRVNTAVRLEKAGFITAGAAAGLFLVTWLLWPSSPETASVAVAPRPDGIVVFAAGSF